MQKFGLTAFLVLVVAHGAFAAGGAHIRKATVAPPTGGAACMTGHFLSHAAYLPAGPEAVAQCGHLLSTDTMLRVHRFAAT